MSDEIINELTERIQRLKDGFEGCCTACEPVGEMNQKLRQEVEQLRKERDEARRDVCDMMHITGFLAGDYADSRGWDCFPDTKQNVSKEVENFITIMQRDYNAVVAQRDEARRLYCIAFQEITENLGEKNTTGSIAKEMGWDCFKENTND